MTETIELEFDASKSAQEHIKTMQRALQNFARDVRDGAHNVAGIGGALSSVGGAFGGPLGLAGIAATAAAGAAKFALNFGHGRQQLQLLADNSKLTVKEVTALTESLELVGESKDNAQSTVTNFIGALKEFDLKGWAGNARAALLKYGDAAVESGNRIKRALDAEGIRGGMQQSIKEIRAASPEMKEALGEWFHAEPAELNAIADHYEERLSRLPKVNDKAIQDITTAYDGMMVRLHRWAEKNIYEPAEITMKRWGLNLYGGHGPPGERSLGERFERLKRGERWSAWELLWETSPPHAAMHWRDYLNFWPQIMGYDKPFATGGIVNHPTVTMLGLDGPQAVIPLGSTTTGGRGPSTVGGSIMGSRTTNLVPMGGGDLLETKRQQRALLTDIRDSLQRIDIAKSGNALTGAYTGPGSDSAAIDRFGGGPLPKGERMEVARRMYNEAIRLGYTHEQASAMLAHVQAESGFNPHATGDRGTAHGFFQHRFDRWERAVQKARAENSDPYSPEAAVRHFDEELRTNERAAGERLRNAKTVDEAVTALNQYERFAGWQHGQPQRYSYGRMFAQAMKEPLAGDILRELQTAGNVRELQAKVAAVRRGQLDPRLRAALAYASEKTGLTVDVMSGGQRMPGAPGATGSHRHDEGRAADLFLRDSNGNIIRNPDDPRALQFFYYAGMAGVSGGGAGPGYMAPGEVHLDTSGSIYYGSKDFRNAIRSGNANSGSFAEEMDRRLASESQRDGGQKVKVNMKFTNVPEGVRTKTKTDSDVIDLRTTVTKDREFIRSYTGPGSDSPVLRQ